MHGGGDIIDEIINGGKEAKNLSKEWANDNGEYNIPDEKFDD